MTSDDGPATGRPRRMIRTVFRPVCCVALAGAFLAGCASPGEDSFLGLITPYRMEVVQGNVVTQEMAAELREGLSREQVRMLLGSPLLTDMFHADRWDYVFTIRRQGAKSQERRVTVFFENDRVARFDAGQLPSEREFVRSIDVAKPEERKPVLELSEDKLRALPLPKAGSKSAAAPADAASGPQRSYPPLEPVTP